MCLKPVRTTIRNVVTGSTKPQVVPCGTCIECLKRKQNDYAFIMAEHAKTHSKLDLVTLTYRDSAIPFAGVIEAYLPDSGEVVEKSGIFWLNPGYHHVVRKAYYRNDAPSGHQMEVPLHYLDGLEDCKVEHHVGIFFGDEVDLVTEPKSVFNKKVGRTYNDAEIRAVVTSSLRREDVKQALKHARIRFRRLYGYNAKFKYFEVGEYGEKRSRPHYHLLFFDAPDTFLEIFRQIWFVKYGNTDLEPVVARGADSLAVAHEKVSRYLAKYLAKGCFEKSFCRLGYVERPRRISSTGLAHDQLPALRRYVLAFDVFGEYDPDCPPSAVLKNLDLIVSRRYVEYSRDGQLYKLRIPNCLYEKVLSKTYGLSKDARQALGFSRSKEASFVLRVSHLRTLLYRKIQSYKKKHYEDLISELVFQASGNRSSGPSSLVFRNAYASISGTVQEVRKKNARSSWLKLRDFYASSKDGQ